MNSSLMMKEATTSTPQTLDLDDMDVKSIAAVAMLTRLEISQWTARLHDKRVSDQVADTNKSNRSAGRYNKQLIPKSDLSRLSTLAREIRDFHYQNTLPWTDSGYRILPTSNHAFYATEMRSYTEKYDAAVADFIMKYPEIKGEARKHLGNMYDAKEYPSTEQLLKKFCIDVAYSPLPQAGDFRVDLSAETVEAIRKDIDRRLKNATIGAVKDLWTRIQLVVEHVQNKLHGYKPGYGDQRAVNVFRASLIENVRELVEVLPRLNIMKDPELDRIQSRMLNELCGHSADELRADPTLRRSTAQAASDILSQMNNYLGDLND